MLAAAIAATLPDPGEPTTVPFAGVLGLLIATTIALLRGQRGADLQRAGFHGSYAGAALGLLVYGIALATNL
ncbi:MAG: hypothetical protein WD649_01225 [Thermoleophilaceae bacterium]